MAHLSVSQQIQHATPTASGPGYVVASINSGGTTHDVITYNHSALTKYVHQAEKYASKHGGDLPNSTFWNLTTSIFREDKALFRELHQCKELLTLLKRNEIYDRNHQVKVNPTPITPTIPIVSTPTTAVPLGNPSDINVTPSSVPEPASALLMGVGLLCAMVAGRRRLVARAAR